MTDSCLIGSIRETFLFPELRKYLSATAPEASVWFYRGQSREADVVIEKAGTGNTKHLEPRMPRLPARMRQRQPS